VKPFFAALLLLAACTPGMLPAEANKPGSAIPSNLVLRSYDVPNGAAPQVKSLLSGLLWFGNEGKDSQKYIGRCDVGPDGRLVVMAPEAVQEGVKGLIAQVASKAPEKQQVIEFNYWLVLGEPAKEKGGAPSPGLGEVQAALNEIEKVDGPMTFTLSEKLSGMALSGEVASTSGRKSEARSHASVHADGIRAEVHIERFGQRFNTRMNLKPGQIVVLGSSGADATDPKELPRSVYYLVRAAIHDGSSR
jgi:hypothetical protein